MQTVRSILALLLVAATAVTSFAASNSYIGVPRKVAGQNVRWKAPAVTPVTTISLSISASLLQPNGNIKFGSDVITALNKSLQAWQDAADVEFEWESTDKTNASPANAGDGVSLITIAPSAENALLFSHEAQNDAAKTRVFHDSKGNITEADIVLNPYQQFSDDGTFGTFDLQAALTHELGHLLGLKHSAVLGSTMAGSFPKNGLFGVAELGARKLDDSDIASVRELYGAKDDDLCCAAVSGKLPVATARAARAAYVWAEDTQTRRVMGLADVAIDGSFMLAGLPVGAYSVYWQRFDESGSSIGELGEVDLQMRDNKVLGADVKQTPRRSAFSVGYVGLNNQLADSAIDLTRGQQNTVYIAGNELAASSLNIEATSPLIKIDPTSLASQDLGNGVTVVSFRVSVSDQATPGTYSLFVNRGDGAKTALIGAFRIE